MVVARPNLMRYSVACKGECTFSKAPARSKEDPEKQGYSPPIACPRTGIILGAGNEHLCNGTCSVAVVKDIRRGTLDAMSSKVQALKQAAMDAMVASRSSADSNVPREEVDGRHMGHTKTDLLQEFAAALAKGRRGQFQKKDFKYGINLTTQQRISGSNTWRTIKTEDGKLCSYYSVVILINIYILQGLLLYFN